MQQHQHAGVDSTATLEPIRTRSSSHPTIQIIAYVPRVSLTGRNRSLLCDPDIKVVASVETYEQFARSASLVKIVVLKHGRDESYTRRLAARISGDFPDISIIVDGLPDSNASAVAMLAAGAVGYTRRSDPPGQLARVVHAVAHGEILVERRILWPLLRRFSTTERIMRNYLPQELPQARLTPRQQEVLELIAEGLNNREIASHLSVSVSTVKNHVNRILTELGVVTRQQAGAIHLQRCVNNSSDD